VQVCRLDRSNTYRAVLLVQFSNLVYPGTLENIVCVRERGCGEYFGPRIFGQGMKREVVEYIQQQVVAAMKYFLSGSFVFGFTHQSNYPKCRLQIKLHFLVWS
jgi:hypothetical protein